MGPLRRMYHSIRELLFPHHYKIQSFTFYIPSPPSRKVGYREKEFDKIFYQFINKGYQILDFKTESNAGQAHSGMWAIFVVKSLSKEGAQLNLEQEHLDYTEETEVEGLYQINDTNDF